MSELTRKPRGIDLLAEAIERLRQQLAEEDDPEWRADLDVAIQHLISARNRLIAQERTRQARSCEVWR